MIKLCELNQAYCESVAKDKGIHAKSALKEIDYMNHSSAKYHGRCVSTLYIPKIFTEDDICRFQRLIRDLYVIFDKVILRYREDKNYRELFGFEKRLEELILRTPRYKSSIPIARIVIFYN